MQKALLYNQTNSGLESLTFAGPNYIDIRINGVAFDKKMETSVTNSRVKVKSFENQWSGSVFHGKYTRC
jgi:hypothetical protein